MSESIDAWFKREILVHERLLMGFLRRVWPLQEEIADIRQEAYARVYEAATRSLPHSPKAFLFSIARYIMADRRRRERIVSIQSAGDYDFSNDIIEERSPDRSVGARQELVSLARAFDRLPAQSREVMWMRRVQELSQREVAHRLGITEKTVEHQVSKGSRLLAQYMLDRDDDHRAATNRGESVTAVRTRPDSGGEDA